MSDVLRDHRSQVEGYVMFCRSKKHGRMAVNDVRVGHRT